jgi:hypothetical protein
MKDIEILDKNIKFYYMKNEVILLHLNRIFNLAKIKLLNTNTILTVDFNALSYLPDMTKTISIGVLGGNVL